MFWDPISSEWPRRESMATCTIDGYRSFWKRAESPDEGQCWQILYSHNADKDVSRNIIFNNKNDAALRSLKAKPGVFEYALVFSNNGNIDKEFVSQKKFKVFCGRSDNIEKYFNSMEWIKDNYGYMEIALEGPNDLHEKRGKYNSNKRAIVFRVVYDCDDYRGQRAHAYFLTHADYAWNTNLNPASRAIYLEASTSFCCLNTTKLRMSPRKIKQEQDEESQNSKSDIHE